MIKDAIELGLAAGLTLGVKYMRPHSEGAIACPRPTSIAVGDSCYDAPVLELAARPWLT